MKTLTFALAILLLGCTQDKVFTDASKTIVDGEVYLVRQLRLGTYQALPNVTADDALFSTDAMVWGRNVRAIEQVTGCTVVLGSVKNDFTNTIAAVEC